MRTNGVSAELAAEIVAQLVAPACAASCADDLVDDDYKGLAGLGYTSMAAQMGRLQGGQGVVAALTQAGDAPQPVIPEGVAAVEMTESHACGDRWRAARAGFVRLAQQVP